MQNKMKKAMEDACGRKMELESIGRKENRRIENLKRLLKIIETRRERSGARREERSVKKRITKWKKSKRKEEKGKEE